MDGQPLYLRSLDTHSHRVRLVFISSSALTVQVLKYSSCRVPTLTLTCTLYSCKHTVLLCINVYDRLVQHGRRNTVILITIISLFEPTNEQILRNPGCCSLDRAHTLYRPLEILCCWYTQTNKPAFGEKKILNNASACKSTGEADPKISLRSHHLCVDGKLRWGFEVNETFLELRSETSVHNWRKSEKSKSPEAEMFQTDLKRRRLKPSTRDQAHAATVMMMIWDLNME